MSVLASADGKLHLFWRFLISFIATALVVLFSSAIPALFGIGGIAGLALDRSSGAVLLLLIYLFFLRVIDFSTAPAEDLGFPAGGVAQLTAGFAFAAAMILLAVAVIAIAGNYTVQAKPAAFTYATLIALTLLGGALFEELAFRGYAFQRLCELITPPGAILFFSALFGAIHYFNPSWSWIAFVNTLLVGVLFALTFLYTRSMWLVWGMHFGWNFVLGTIFGLPVSGLHIFQTWINGDAEGHPLLTGGSYGIEASLTGTAVILLGIVLTPVALKAWKHETAGTNSGIQTA